MPNAAVQCAPVVGGVVAAAAATFVAADGIHANEGAAAASPGMRLHGTSGMRQGGTPGAVPHNVPPLVTGAADGARSDHVPAPTLICTRANGRVLVRRPFTEYEAVLAE